jgi:hypothetical protein
MVMSKLFLILSLALTHFVSVNAQSNIFSTSNGKVRFFSKAPLEDISAQNNSAVSFINILTRQVVVKITIDKFDFPNKLMQEHFNENYLESDKYPTATFQGKINEEVSWDKFGTYEVSATGVLNIHGKSVPKTIKGKLQVGENNLRLDSRFLVPLAEHNIKIPKLLFSNISEKIEVTCQFNYVPHKKK